MKQFPVYRFTFITSVATSSAMHEFHYNELQRNKYNIYLFHVEYLGKKYFYSRVPKNEKNILSSYLFANFCIARSHLGGSNVICAFFGSEKDNLTVG